MIELTLLVEDLEYTDLLDKQMPVIFKTMSENGDISGPLKLACSSPEATTKVIKGLLKVMTRDQKEKLACKLVNSNREKLMRKANQFAAKYGVEGKVVGCTATKR